MHCAQTPRRLHPLPPPLRPRLPAPPAPVCEPAPRAAAAAVCSHGGWGPRAPPAWPTTARRHVMRRRGLIADLHAAAEGQALVVMGGVAQIHGFHVNTMSAWGLLGSEGAHRLSPLAGLLLTLAPLQGPPPWPSSRACRCVGEWHTIQECKSAAPVVAQHIPVTAAGGLLLRASTMASKGQPDSRKHQLTGARASTCMP